MMKKILVVDDEPHIARLVKNILLSEKYEVDEVNTATAAIEKIQNKKYDLVILDIMMPNMNGYELCERLREEPDTYDLPVIFLTAKHAVSDKIEAIHVGADDYITKPFNPDELVMKVNNLISEHAKLPQVS